MALEPDSGTNRDYMLRHALSRLEEERLSAAIYSCQIYAYMEGMSEQKDFEKLIKDVSLFRKFGLIESIKNNPETAPEYYDENKENDIYPFDEVFERRIAKMTKENPSKKYCPASRLSMEISSSKLAPAQKAFSPWDWSTNTRTSGWPAASSMAWANRRRISPGRELLWG